MLLTEIFERSIFDYKIQTSSQNKTRQINYDNSPQSEDQDQWDQ